ncbi:mannosyltransferase [Fistulina hepatica ATCC 64428]|uniref:GDP-Man:Man(3)GlcNAc(2)-PP-Dol alpha-1,2-mannosyltransferase n=1 Tax=Fistulina hepatica ATCC 64428 TaxID=1128425 RepID=A0A0D7ALD5_9AGAR|nr:mannosyltransferase [Fistulina hepatica ATCC 64428]
MALFTFVLLFLSALYTAFYLYGNIFRSRNAFHRSAILDALRLPASTRILGFFHPYCESIFKLFSQINSHAGGGGERVLWTAIASIQRSDPNILSVVYTGDVDATKDAIIAKVKSRFDISINPAKVHFAYLRSRHLVDDATWPHFTLLGQSLGSTYLAWEAMSQIVPDLYIDTMGYTFAYPVIALLAACPVGAYLHYPTISLDMLSRVQARKVWHTNSSTISSSYILSYGKIVYYRWFMYHYSMSLRHASFIMVNGSFTKGHIDSLLIHRDMLMDIVHFLPPFIFLRPFLRTSSRVHSTQLVYPPCDTHAMAAFPLEHRENVIMSLAQFRPEKDHAAQLQAFAKLLHNHPEHGATRLVLIGGSRNAGDAARVEDLQAQARELSIENSTEFVVNAPYPTVLDWLSRANIGLSTMIDEHFGINVVEFMAAGLIPVVHASGGPLKDIVVPFEGQPTGFHAGTPDEFAEVLNHVLSLSADELLMIRRRARAWAVQRFSEEEFEKAWNASGWKSHLPLR